MEKLILDNISETDAKIVHRKLVVNRVVVGKTSFDGPDLARQPARGQTNPLVIQNTSALVLIALCDCNKAR
eukprot:15352970-Ditylum_brightwellii.AAC.2